MNIGWWECVSFPLSMVKERWAWATRARSTTYMLYYISTKTYGSETFVNTEGRGEEVEVLADDDINKSSSITFDAPRKDRKRHGGTRYEWEIQVISETTKKQIRRCWKALSPLLSFSHSWYWPTFSSLFIPPQHINICPEWSIVSSYIIFITCRISINEITQLISFK